MKYKVILTIALAVVALSSFAQRNKAKKKATPTPVVTVSHADIRFEEMLPSTQRVLFIDSLVVDKNKVLSSIGLDPELGKADSTSYTDGRQLRTFYCNKDRKGKVRLYTASKIDGKWGDERLIAGLDSLDDICYPYMLADGATLCFAARSSSAIGGLDIFMTRYDDEECSVMEPESVGLPFCSKDDDFIYYIDQRDSLGWFVSDRNQPQGKACIYIFATNGQRITYSEDDFDEDEIKHFAHLNSIKDTWKDNVPERIAAMERLKNMRKRSEQNESSDDFLFVVSDKIVYHSWGNFRSAEAKEAYLNAVTMKSKRERLAEELDVLRIKYTKDTNPQLKAKILANEEELQSMSIEIDRLTKNAITLEQKILK